MFLTGHSNKLIASHDRELSRLFLNNFYRMFGKLLDFFSTVVFILFTNNVL